MPKAKPFSLKKAMIRDLLTIRSKIKTMINKARKKVSAEMMRQRKKTHKKEEQSTLNFSATDDVPESAIRSLFPIEYATQYFDFLNAFLRDFRRS